MSTKPHKNGFVIFSILIVTAINIYYFYTVSYNLFYGIQSYKWPSVFGQYIKYDVGVQNEISYTDTRMGLVEHEHSIFKADILYSYIIDDVSYQNNRVSFPNTYPKGYSDSLLIYYNPSDPKKSTLIIGLRYTLSDLFLLFFILSIDVVLFLIIKSPKLKK